LSRPSSAPGMGWGKRSSHRTWSFVALYPVRGRGRERYSWQKGETDTKSRRYGEGEGVTQPPVGWYSKKKVRLTLGRNCGVGGVGLGGSECGVCRCAGARVRGCAGARRAHMGAHPGHHKITPRNIRMMCNLEVSTHAKVSFPAPVHLL
jgi:hypothetical protein